MHDTIDRIGIDRTVSTLFDPDDLRDELSDQPVDSTIIDGSDESVAACDAVITFVHRESYRSLSWVHTVQAGVDRFPHEDFREAGVILTNSSGIHGDAIGETVAGFVLSFARRLHIHIANQQQREWVHPDPESTWTVNGQSACVVGLGGLGRGIVDRLTRLGLRVVGVRRSPTLEPGIERVHPSRELRSAVADAKFVVLAVPLTDDTRQMVDMSVFESMRDDAYLINVARGGVVVQDDLLTALQDGSIAGAALDVFETEPLPDTSPLWSMDNVIVSPHCGAFNREYVAHVGTILRESIARLQDGEDPVNRVL